MDRFARVMAILKGESITVKNENLYKELLSDIDEDVFSTHIDALKEMASDGEKYILEAVQAEDGTISLKTVHEETGETSEVKEEPAGTTEQSATETPSETNADKPAEQAQPDQAAEAKSGEASSPAPIEKKDGNDDVLIEMKAAIESLQTQFSTFLETVTNGNKQIETFKGEVKNSIDELQKSLDAKLIPLKKKLKDVEDVQFSMPKKLSVDRVVRKSIDEVVSPEAPTELFKSIFPVEMQGEILNFSKAQEDTDENSDE